MTSIVKLPNGKYTIYNRRAKYLGFKGSRYNSKYQPETRFVNIDWKNAITPIISASTSDKCINTNTEWHRDEKNKDVKLDNEEKLNAIELIDESDFWALISRIRCCDKDEGGMTKNNIRLNNDECRDVLLMINGKYIPELKTVLTNIPILDGIDASDYNNLLTHIIAKGRAFYNGIMENPVVSLYLCDQFYPVYTWINQLV